MVQTIPDSWKRLHTRKLLRKKQQQHKNCADRSLASPEVSQSHASHQTPNSSKTPLQTPQNTSKNKKQNLKNRTNNNKLSNSSIPSTSQNNEKLNPKVKLFYKPQPRLKDRHVSIFSITTYPWPTDIAIKHQKYKSTGKKPHRATPLHKHQEHEQEVSNQTLNCDTDQT
jgi:hypothetical protein